MMVNDVWMAKKEQAEEESHIGSWGQARVCMLDAWNPTAKRRDDEIHDLRSKQQHLLPPYLPAEHTQ